GTWSTSGPVARGTSCGPYHVRPPPQRLDSSSDLMSTNLSAWTAGNSTWMTVATLEYTESSTSVAGWAVTPCVVFLGARILKVVHTVVNGGTVKLAQIRDEAAAQDGPPHTTAAALPAS